MGSGIWTTDVYDARAKARAHAGTATFDYDARRSHTPRSSWRPHPTLDPFGVKLRESRDSVDHPNSLAIAVMLDVTGSMREIPLTLQRKLPELHGLLLRKGYVEQPQILFGAMGDATCDQVPLQVGQFESDNHMDENLENLVLEGGGGGQKTESYELALYFCARHTALDCFEKRGKRGYLFLIGDEMAYGDVKHTEIERLIGAELAEDLPVAQLVAEVQRYYDLYYILPRSAGHGGDPEVLAFWRGLLGQNVLELEDPEAVCETVALTIGLAEGTIDLHEGIGHLSEFGVDSKTVRSVALALQTLSDKAVAKTSGALLPALSAGRCKATRRI